MVCVMSVSSDSLYSSAPASDEQARLVQERRNVLHALAVELREVEIELGAVRSEIDGSQSYLRLMVPRPLLDQQLAALAQYRDHGAVEGTQGDAQDILSDVRVFAELEGTKQALARLVANNRRFAMVVDLMGAAMHLLEPATDMLAQGFLQLHMRQCRELMHQVRGVLTDFPRTQLPLFKSFAGDRVS